MSEATGTTNKQQVRAAWIEAMRPRTLPLAAAGSVVAAGIAAAAGQFRIEVLVLMFVTSILLQIIANFADDYGDLSHGLDDETRVGPTVRGLFPCGEGAGYAGGITSAAVDGLRCAEEILKQSL